MMTIKYILAKAKSKLADGCYTTVATLLDEIAAKLPGWQDISSTTKGGWMLVPRGDGMFSGVRIVLRVDETDKGYGISYLDEIGDAICPAPTKYMPACAARRIAASPLSTTG